MKPLRWLGRTRTFRRDRRWDDPPDLGWDRTTSGNAGAARMTVEYDGETFECLVETSRNDWWRAAFGPSNDRSHQRLFLFAGDELRTTVPVDRPKSCAVADDGTTVVAGRGEADEVGGTATLFDRGGEELLAREWDANVSAVDVAPDGRYAAAVTLEPDCRTYIFDSRDGELLAVHENREGNKHLTRFRKASAGEWHLYLSGKGEPRPLYAIDATGEIAWTSSRFDPKRFSLLDAVTRPYSGGDDGPTGR